MARSRLSPIWTGSSQGLRNDGDAELLVALELHLLQHDRCSQQGNIPARHNAFLNRGTCGMQSISRRDFSSFISVWVAAPVLMTATPPASFAQPFLDALASLLCLSCARPLNRP
jgi:hypothetical protein